MTTLHASSAGATAAYYAKYLTAAPGEVPGMWCGRQSDGIGLVGEVTVHQLEQLLSGRDPATGTPLGRELLDRYTSDGRLVPAVSGFDATFSAPKSVSVLWALTGDRRFLDAHDIAVSAALAHLERYGSTTRIRSDGGRLHPDTRGLTMATFRQTTSRADDPQLHTHALISAKVQTVDGRWLALDARYLKRHQRMLGGLYQSALRSQLTNTLGVAWQPIVNGQAEIAGTPDELLRAFSKRTADIEHALTAKLAAFRQREGRNPSRWEHAALTREASADTRSRKSGHGAADLLTRWRDEASDAGWTAAQLRDTVERAARSAQPARRLHVDDVLNRLSLDRSTWCRADIVQAICDHQRPLARMPGERWAGLVEQAADRVLEHCIDLDPPDATTRRASDGRSAWIEPTAPRFTSDGVLAQEEAIITWAIGAQQQPPRPSTTLDDSGLDILQAEAAAAVAGRDELALVVGPAGAGKTRMLAAAVDDLHRHNRPVFGAAPTAKAARVLAADTSMPTTTVAKLLHEWRHPDRAPLDDYRLPPGTTVIVDEASMLATPVLFDLVSLADGNRWRLALVGDHRQLQAVGRGGMFAELCERGRVTELEQLHRFTHDWEAAASLKLRHGDPAALDAYQAQGRIIAGPIETHLQRMAATWIDHHRHGDTIALVASTNDHADAINHAVQFARVESGDLSLDTFVYACGGDYLLVGDVIATRRNHHQLVTTTGEPVRNRDTWTVTTVAADGSLTATHEAGHGTITLPADYVRQHVRLGYAATEHGYQGATVDTALSLASASTTRRGLYVATTRGRDNNTIYVVTDSTDIAEARDILDGVIGSDRADIPAITQRARLTATTPAREIGIEI